MLLMTDFSHDARVTKEANSLVKAGHRIIVFALKSKHTPQIERRNGFFIHRIVVRSRHLLPKTQVFFFIKYIEYIIQTVKKLWSMPFDAYHAHDLETLPIGFIISRCKRKPLVYDSHELYPQMAKHRAVARILWNVIESLLSGKTDFTILTTDSRGQFFKNRYRVKAPVIIRNCPVYFCVKKHDKFREILPIKNGDRIVLYQGAISKGRGLDVLLETSKLLTGTAFIIMGDGPSKENIQKIITAQYSDTNVYLLDAVPWRVLHEYTSSADLGISLVQNTNLNHYTMLSNKLFEYLNAGLPVIFPDFPELRNLVMGSHVGVVVDETSPEAVTDAIKEILDDKDLYNTMSRNAKRIVKEKYNWEVESGKLLEIYDTLS